MEPCRPAEIVRSVAGLLFGQPRGSLRRKTGPWMRAQWMRGRLVPSYAVTSSFPMSGPVRKMTGQSVLRHISHRRARQQGSDGKSHFRPHQGTGLAPNYAARGPAPTVLIASFGTGRRRPAGEERLFAFPMLSARFCYTFLLHLLRAPR